MTPLRVLMAHDYYRQAGGEEESFHAEVALLREYGHDVITFTRSNADIDTRGVARKANLFLNTIWSVESYKAIKEVIRRHRPDIAHFQNTFPLISPSAYYACREERVPVVQTLRNYRIMCANSLFLRDGRICEDCLGKFIPWPGVLHACYRGSRSQSASVAAMLTYHRARATWTNDVDMYIALTDMGRSKFMEAGLPADQIRVKPNYMPDPGTGISEGGYVLYVGRLSEEKGIRLLLDAWRRLPEIPLKLIGAGPLDVFARSEIQGRGLNAELAGRLPHADAISRIREAAFVVFPSLCYESFGRPILEAFACGRTVIGPRNGTSMELIDDGRTGLHFSWNDADDLALQVRRLWSQRELAAKLGNHAREEYLAKYTPARNYEILMSIYGAAIARTVG